MFTPAQIFFLIVLPTVLAALIAFLGWRLFPKKARRWNHAATLALTLGPLMGGLITNRPQFPPREAFDWLILTPAAALAVSFVTALLPRVAAALLLAFTAAVETWLLIPPANPTLSTSMLILAAASAAAGLFAMLEGLSLRAPRSTLPAAFFIVAAAAVIVELASNGIQYSQFVTTLPAASFGLLLAAIFSKSATVARGGSAAFILMLVPVLAYGHLWVDTPPARTVLLIAALPGLWFSQMPPFKKLPALWQITLALLPVVLAASIAAVPAARELFQLLHSQTDTSGY